MSNIQDYKIPPSTTTIIAKGDSAAPSHYCFLIDIDTLQNVVAGNFVPEVVLPDTSTLKANATGKSLLSSPLSYTSNKTAVFDNPQHSMISLGQLCDEN